MTEDVQLDYDFLMQKALRRLMHDVISLVAEIGDAPGEHHFYIEFLTQHPGVVMPDHLKEEYPERMTIVLQHQFQNLTLSDEGFAVTLWFKGKETRLEVPFVAVTSFADPSVQFGLRFEPVAKDAPEESSAQDNEPEEPEDDAPEEGAKKEVKGKESADPKNKESGADIVNLDAFRKK